jgi:uncharacterized membrane protein YqiK
MNLLGMIEIASDEVGIVLKKFGPKLPPGRTITLNGEAGYQADTLLPGRYFGFYPWLYRVEKAKAISIPEGEIGLVIAQDGEPTPEGQKLCKAVACDFFQNARAFLESGGQKGRQLEILTAGTYSINTKLFTVITSTNAIQYGMKSEDLRVYTVSPGKVGIVTTNDGVPFPDGQIAALSFRLCRANI